MQKVDADPFMKLTKLFLVPYMNPTESNSKLADAVRVT